MKYSFLFCGLFLLLLGCAESKPQIQLKEGVWLGELTTMDDQRLPFNFKLYTTPEGKYMLDIVNAQELITVDEITTSNDSIVIKAPGFNGKIVGMFTPNSITGTFIIETMDRRIPFRAEFNTPERFRDSELPELNISGIWETEFSPKTENLYMGKGIFTQKEGKVSGTFRTPTGDYRFLEGVLDKDSLKLSAFDGAHAFLFLAKATDSSLNGMFYSGNHFKEPFTALRNEAFELPSPDSLTFIKEGYDRLDFSFPDTKGNMVSLSDKKFKNKVVIVQLMGTWCPNCLDETRFLIEHIKEANQNNLQIIGLAFEYAKTEEAAINGIERLADRAGINYPILLAQYGTSSKEQAQQKLPMLNRVLAYPTTIFIDKKGDVRRIQTGFNGPATGATFVQFKAEFKDFVAELLQE